MLLKIIILMIISFNEGKRSHILKLFIRGNIKSIELIINGMNQFLVLPIMIGIVIKKIITNAWRVIIE